MFLKYTHFQTISNIPECAKAHLHLHQSRMLKFSGGGPRNPRYPGREEGKGNGGSGTEKGS